MTPRPPAEDAVFVLQAHEVNVIDIQEISSAAIRLNIFFNEFKPHPGGISVTGLEVVDRHGDARRFAIFGGDSFAEVGGKGGNAALARQIVTNEGQTVEG